MIGTLNADFVDHTDSSIILARGAAAEVLSSESEDEVWVQNPHADEVILMPRTMLVTADAHEQVGGEIT